MSNWGSQVNWGVAILISGINLAFPVLHCVFKMNVYKSHEFCWTFLSFQLEHLSENYRFISLPQNTAYNVCCSPHVDSLQLLTTFPLLKVLNIVASAITWSSNCIHFQNNLTLQTFLIQAEVSICKRTEVSGSWLQYVVWSLHQVLVVSCTY